MSEAPRNFKLLDEYDSAIGKQGHDSFIPAKHQGFITYGIDESTDEWDMTMSHWTAMIIGIQGKQTGEMFFSIRIKVPEDYPEKPPDVYFVAPQIAMDAVDGNGYVDLSKLVPKFTWTKSKSIADVLSAIRDNMEDSEVNKNSACLINTSYE